MKGGGDQQNADQFGSLRKKQTKKNQSIPEALGNATYK